MAPVRQFSISSIDRRQFRKERNSFASLMDDDSQHKKASAQRLVCEFLLFIIPVFKFFSLRCSPDRFLTNEEKEKKKKRKIGDSVCYCHRMKKEPFASKGRRLESCRLNAG
jgi:hypothetical protein